MAIKRVPAKVARRTQPKQGLQINWGSPLTSGLSLAFVGGKSVDYTKNYKLVPSGAIQTAVNSAGISSIGSATSYFTTSPPLPDSGTEFSVVALVRYVSGSYQGYFTKVKPGASTTGQWNFTASDTGFVRLEVQSATTGSVFGSTSLVSGKVYVIAATYKSGSASIYVNGGLDGTGTLPALTPTISPFATILNYITGPGFPATGGVSFIGVWNKRALSATEVAKISKNVFGTIFAPTLAPIWQGAGTISRPNSDIVVSGWTSSDAQPLYSDIDETSPSDVDYIYSPDLAGALTPATFGLTATLPAGTHDVHFRARRTLYSGDARVLLLDSGGSTVGTTAWQTLSAALADYSLSVTTTGTAARVSIEVRQ